MIELPPSDFHKVRALFAPLMASQMFCAGVLEGLYQGRVFVDDAENPRCGFVTKDTQWWFLAGDAHNAAFNQALNTGLLERTVTGEKSWGGMLVCFPDDWDAQMSAIYAPHIPNTTDRLHYTCRQPNLDWRSQVPDGFEIRFVDESLAADGIEVQGAAADVLELRRDTPEPDHKAVGFVAVHGGKIVASSVIDCMVSGGGDIGLFTDPAFRRRNLAFLTSAAVIEYALAHGVEVVHWDCQSFNTGSIKTAEKLGLILDHTHRMHTLILNPVIHEVNRAWGKFDAGLYDDAEAICQRHIEAEGEKAHVHFYYIVARCQAETGQPDAAMRALELAAKQGWKSVDEAQGDFAALTAHPSWNSIVAQIQTNAQPQNQ